MSAHDKIPWSVRVPMDAVEETITAYDTDADVYGQRFAKVDVSPYMADFLEAVPGGAKVLDAGCGSGRDLAALIGQGVKAIGLDRSGGMLAIAQRAARQAPLVRGDLRSLPFADSTFGGVWQYASLLHLMPEDSRAAIAEVRRVLQPGGAFFLSVASGHGAEWRKAGTGRRWFYYYSYAEIERIITDEGMEIVLGATEPGTVHGTWINVLALNAA